jgi:hypothetical protein
MFEAIKRRFGKEPEPVDPVFAALTEFNNAHCPDCNGKDFLMGPHGGMSQNIKCANPRCGSEFNCAPFDEGWRCGQPFMAERISPPSPLAVPDAR